MLSSRAVSLCAFCWPLVIGMEVGHAEPPGPGDTAARSDPAPPERSAKQAFDQGLELVRDQRFLEAIAAFETAYSLEPHYAVLYNISQCYVQLGELDHAVTNLERYLEEGAANIPEPLRAERERRLALLKAQREAARVSEQPADVVPVAESSPELPPDGRARSEIEPGALALQTPAAPPQGAASGPSFTAVAVTGATGLALVGAGAGLWIWNQRRVEQWERTDDELGAYRACYPHCALPDDFNTRQAENNDLSDSIQRYQIIAISTGVLGLGFIGTSAYLASTGDDADAASTALSLAPGFVSVTRTW